jgi:hypothetical protein
MPSVIKYKTKRGNVMGSYLGPVIAILGVSSIFVFLSYILSKKRLLMGFIPTLFLVLISAILFINVYLGSQEGFNGAISVILSMFFMACALITVIATIIINRHKIFKKRI